MVKLSGEGDFTGVYALCWGLKSSVNMRFGGGLTRGVRAFLLLRMSRWLSIGLGVAASGWGIAADWPRFLGPNGDGTSPETELLDAWPAAGPERIFSVAVGTGYSAPAVLGRRLVLHHRRDDREIVECFELPSARSMWQHSASTSFVDPYGYNNGPRSTPWLTTNRCYTFGAEGLLLCLDLETGREVWSRQTSQDWNVPEAFFGVGSSPVLEGTRLLVMVGGQPDAGMVAFDAETGCPLWESVGRSNWEGQPMRGHPGERPVVWRETDKQASYASPVVATVHGERLAFCLMRQGLVALDPASGKVCFSRWFRARVEESVNAANPVVVGDEVFLSAAYYRVGSVLLRVDRNLRGFTELWQDTVLEAHWSTPIHHEGYLYAFSGRNEPDARFRCVELRSGTLRWERDEGWRRGPRQPAAYGRASAILADGKLVVLGEGGLLGQFAVDPRQPRELARFQVPELSYPCWTGPVLSDRRLFLRSEDRLICFDLGGG
jgi:outer membrane protein assembly factor BamB